MPLALTQEDFLFIYRSTVQGFIAKHELVLAEMRVLSNDSTFGENDILGCYQKLNQYRELTNYFTELIRLASLEKSVRDVENISVAVDSFLFLLHEYEVGAKNSIQSINFLLVCRNCSFGVRSSQKMRWFALSVLIVHSQDVQAVIKDCYWFESYTWWRITKKAPCLPDIIYHRKSHLYIDQTDLEYLNQRIGQTNDDYCDDKIQTVTNGALMLKRKN